MKKEARIIGIDDSPFDKFKDKQVLVIGTIYRGGNYLDGLVSTKVKVDGIDATTKIINMINNCKFKPQLQFIMLDGIAVAGFNIIDIEKLFRATKLPVIVTIRKYPDFLKIQKTLKKLNMGGKYKLLQKAGKVIKIHKIYCQLKGISADKAAELLRISCTHSNIPEPLRVAHLIAGGIVSGESKGRA